MAQSGKVKEIMESFGESGKIMDVHPGVADV
jgi:hypothetical protein